MEQKKKKSIFKKWWFWLIAIIVVGAIGGGTGESTLETADTKTTTPVEKNESSKKEKPAELSKSGTASDVKFEVNSSSTTSKIGKNEFAQAKAAGVFKVITISVTNNLKDAITMDSNLFKLVDSQGREFSPSTEAQTAIMTDGEEGLFLKELNPGLTGQGKVVFDIPKDAKIVKLVAQGGMIGDSIDLKVD